VGASGFPTPANSYGDVAKGVGMGVAHGAIGLAGLPGDISPGIDKGIGWAILKGAEKAGLLPTNQKTGKMATAEEMIQSAEDTSSKVVGPSPNFAGSEMVQKGVEKLTGPLSQYEPQTPEGQTAERVASFLPASLLGPGGVARAIPNAIRYGLVPGAT